MSISRLVLIIDVDTIDINIIDINILRGILGLIRYLFISV